MKSFIIFIFAAEEKEMCQNCVELSYKVLLFYLEVDTYMIPV